MDDFDRPLTVADMVVHCKRSTIGYDVYIGRPSKWGNPFVVGRDGTREEVIEKFDAYLHSRPDLMAALPELWGKVLGCWCSPLDCHGHVLAYEAALAYQTHVAAQRRAVAR